MREITTHRGGDAVNGNIELLCEKGSYLCQAKKSGFYSTVAFSALNPNITEEVLLAIVADRLEQRKENSLGELSAMGSVQEALDYLKIVSKRREQDA